MSQQINLLVRKRSEGGRAWLALTVPGIVALLMLFWWAIGQREVARAQAAEAASARQLQVVQASLQARTKQSADTGIGMAALKQRAEAGRQLLTLVGGLGNQQGYARYFSSLASISEEGLWITNVTISQAGKSVTISGRALRNESVMRYAQRLNATFAEYGVQFSALELTPESSAARQGTSSPGLTSVAFKLY